MPTVPQPDQFNFDMNALTLMELDIPMLLRWCGVSGTDTEAAAWLGRFITCDPAEITRRAALLEALLKTPGAQQTLHIVIMAAQELCTLQTRLRHVQDALRKCTFTVYLFRVYTESVRRLSALLERVGAPAEEYHCFLQTHMADSAFGEAERFVREQNGFTPLRDITLGINLDDTGSPVQAGVVSVNETGELLGSLLAPGQVPSSLTGKIKLSRSGVLPHLEACLLEYGEKECHVDIIAVTKALRCLDYSCVDRWLSFTKDMSLYAHGLYCADMMLKNGHTLCRPSCGGESLLAIREAVPPLFALEGKHALPMSLEIHKGDTVVITGANHSGKTTLIQAAAQLMVMAQLGFLVPARQFTFQPVSRFDSLFSAGEDGEMELSRFQTELYRLRNILEHTGRGTLLCINEPLTGTNPQEAGPLIADAVRQAARRGATQLLVTHLYDVYRLLYEAWQPGLRSYVMQSSMENGRLVHMYTPRETPPDGISYAYNEARAYRINAEQMVSDPALAALIRRFLQRDGINAPAEEGVLHS